MENGVSPIPSYLSFTSQKKELSSHTKKKKKADVIDYKQD